MRDAKTIGTNSEGRLHRGSRGFTLIEVMVSMTIFVIGALGIASMQAVAFRSGGMARYLTMANHVAVNAAERIERNAENAGAYHGMNTSSGARPNCPVLDPEPVCAQDLAAWGNSVSDLPQGVLQISSTAGANFEGILISIAWEDAVGSHSVNVPLQVAP